MRNLSNIQISRWPFKNINAGFERPFVKQVRDNVDDVVAGYSGAERKTDVIPIRN